MDLFNLFEDLSDEERSIELLESALFEASSAGSDEDNVNIHHLFFFLFHKILFY